MAVPAISGDEGVRPSCGRTGSSRLLAICISAVIPTLSGLSMPSWAQSASPAMDVNNWAAIHEQAVAFLDQRADEAVQLGWTTLDLFGVHPEADTIRSDYCGALILGTEPVSAITETRMRFANTTYYRDKPGRPTGGVPLWAFGR
jgi:hypothetical protein